MVRKLRRNRRVSKETGSNVSAGKGDKVTSKKDPVNNSDSPPQDKKDLTDVVKRLQEVYAATPEKLDLLIKGEERHDQVLGDLENRISEISKVLSPGRDIIARGLAQKLTPVERNKLLL